MTTEKVTKRNIGDMYRAGGIGGLLGFLLGEIASKVVGNGTTQSSAVLTTAVWFSAVILGMGVALTAGSHLFRKDFDKAKALALRAAPMAIVGGAVAGAISQTIYHSMLDPDSIEQAIMGCASRGDMACAALDGVIRPARAIGWCIAGAIGGLPIGLVQRSAKRTQNAVIGGAIGGLLGGLLFDSVDNIFGAGDVYPRAIALLLIGTLIGTATGILDTARSPLVLRITTGELTGRTFLLPDADFTVGCATTAAVTLRGDRSIRELHATFTYNGSSVTFQTLHGSPDLTVNGAPASSGTIALGQPCTIGATGFVLFANTSGALVGTPTGGLASVGSPSPSTPTGSTRPRLVPGSSTSSVPGVPSPAPGPAASPGAQPTSPAASTRPRISVNPPKPPTQS